MRVRWNRVAAVVLLVALGIFLARGGLESLPHVRVGVAVPNDPVVALATFAVIAVTVIAVAKLLAGREPSNRKENHHE